MKPVQCHLWQNETLTQEDLQFENVFTYEDDFHIWHKLKRCPECGQLYFYQFHEEDWMFDDNEEITISYIPIASKEEADKLAGSYHLDIMSMFPQIRKDYPDNLGNPSIRWIGKD